jgi:hypothetical protein
MATALGLDVSYISQLENSKRTVDEWYITRAQEIERHHSHIEKSKLDALAEQGPDYLAARSSEIRAKAHRHLDIVLDACRDDLDSLSWTYVELRRHFPAASPDTSDDPLSLVVGDTAGRVVAEAARQQQAESQRQAPPPPPQSLPPKSSGPEKR